MARTRETQAGTAATSGQQFTATIRRVMHIGPRTKRHRKSALIRGSQDVIADIRETITYAATVPGYYTEATSSALAPGFAAVNSWSKHVDGGRINSVQCSYLTSLSPWEFTALLGEMVDAGITNVGEGERWFAARRDADIAAFIAC